MRGGERAGCAGTAERFCAVPALEQRDHEAGRECVARSRPVERMDVRWPRACDLPPVLEERGSFGAVGDRDELPARDDLVFEAIHDQQVRLEVDRPRGRCVER